MFAKGIVKKHFDPSKGAISRSCFGGLAFGVAILVGFVGNESMFYVLYFDVH